jgi:hypothetical protein
LRSSRTAAARTLATDDEQGRSSRLLLLDGGRLILA